MARNSDQDPFFIGYLSPPKPLRSFLALIGLALMVLFAGISYLMASSQWDPGDGTFRWDWRRHTITGVMTVAPYPVIHVVESERYESGTTVMLSGNGKRGVQERAAPLAGKLVQATGVSIKRGDVDMMQVIGGEKGLSLTEGEAVPVPVEPLGRWRLTGEICDSKCYTGAMRPGKGLAHKACANLCLIGGEPPIFVTTAPVDGDIFLIMADAEGGEVTGPVLDHVATLVEIEGEVERVGSALVFKIDPATITLVP
ncbi:MAG: hypothetical protein NXI16_00055 [Alphaproteobacteria bacterium]|nr:hypothetical protein [Alphaproteobacteria bacterium]